MAPMRRVRAYTPEALATAIAQVAAGDVDDPQVRRTALAIVGRYPKHEWPEMLLAYVLRTTRWIPELGEVVESPVDTLRLGAADCDGLTALYLALSWAVGVRARPVLVGDHEQPVHAMPEVWTGGGWRMVEVSNAAPRDWRHAWRNTAEEAAPMQLQVGRPGAEPRRVMRPVRIVDRTQLVGAMVNPRAEDEPRKPRRYASRDNPWCSTPSGAERWRTGDISGEDCRCPNILVREDRPPEPWEQRAGAEICGNELPAGATRRRGRKMTPEEQSRSRFRPNLEPQRRERLGADDWGTDEEEQERGREQGESSGFPWWLLLVAYYATKK